MLIVLLDEAVGAVRTGVGPVVGREWLRGEPVAGVVEVRGTRWGRVALVVILVVISSYVSSDSRGGWWSGLDDRPTSAFHRWGGRFDGHWERVARQRRCFLVGAVSGLISTTRLGTPGNARGRSDVPGPPYSLTAAVPQGNHFDVEMIFGPPNRFRSRAR